MGKQSSLFAALQMIGFHFIRCFHCILKASADAKTAWASNLSLPLYVKTNVYSYKAHSLSWLAAFIEKVGEQDAE